VVAGRHPLLLEGDQPVIPFALTLEPGERTLVVSGPNTGGKTVLLKAIGLISLMTQAGIIPPVAAGTRIPVFRDVFADIGDEQSIEASLSTFSAHLANLREVVAKRTMSRWRSSTRSGAGRTRWRGRRWPGPSWLS
jgi:DNA mismatch repair protein MutS2